jgi:hypothetical protein
MGEEFMCSGCGWNIEAMECPGWKRKAVEYQGISALGGKLLK